MVKITWINFFFLIRLDLNNKNICLLSTIHDNYIKTKDVTKQQQFFVDMFFRNFKAVCYLK